MALVTLQRSPTPSAASSASTATTTAGEDLGSEDERRANQSLSESFFMVKGAALFLQQGSSHPGQKAHPNHKHAGDLPQHLQVMINILRSEDRIKLAVRLESAWSDRVRYMVVVYTSGRQDTEENILLGIDFTNKDCKSCSIGMVLPLWSDTKIHLDGDGGFSVNTAGRTHVFKPVSVQVMWSALQVLHKVCELSRRYNYFPGGMALTWIGYYESCIASDQSCINEWNAMKDLETTRPDSPSMFVDKPSERERTECLIKAKLRSIMTCQDLENVTCKQIRTELEQHMNCNLKEYKEFIDNEMLLILGQMDKATLIFEHVYLGSEWNASNLEELQETGVRYILNVTREIDNFFPGTFNYHNIRVYDEDATDLLSHWNDTYNFIVKAKKNDSKCLVHCKMGVSRSASTVIAYAMKEYGWTLDKAYDFVKQKRSITRPNAGFMRQLAEYEGILDASKQRHNKLWHPDADCEMAEGPPELAHSGEGEEGRPPAREPSASSCCEEGMSERGAACPSPCRTVSLDIDPAYSMEKVFIEIEDVERDALLDDETFDGREGLPLSHFGPSAAGTAAQTSSRGPEPLEELRLRLEFSTEMEVLMQPDDGGGGGDDAQDVDTEGNGMDLATLNENSNNNKRLNIPQERHSDNTLFFHEKVEPPAVTPPADVSTPAATFEQKASPPLLSELRLNPSASDVPSASLPLSRTSTLTPACGSVCDRADTHATPTPTAPLCREKEPRDPPDKLQLQDSDASLEIQPIQRRESSPAGLCELKGVGQEKPPAACCVGHPQEPLLQLQRSGLVRRRTERLERLSGVSQERLHSPLHTCQRSKRSSSHSEGEEGPGLAGDFPKSSTPCQVRLEPPMTNEALLGLMGSGFLTPNSSPHGSTLTRSSSSNSLHSVRGKPGLVRQRAQEIETRIRLAGLTVPTRLKRSNSLAKLDNLNFSSEDLCSACSSDAGTLLLLSLSPEPE
uniref:Protein phosphatase Slingshot homolog 1 n=1 Tax=Tetraodon nigroviridis TaxID=99883 RepID=H3DEL3_TETNG